MKTYNKIASVIVAGVMALGMTACSVSGNANVNELINTRLAASGSAYTVQSVDASSDETASLINEAAATYKNYKNSLENTDDLAADLADDGRGNGYIKNAVAQAKQRNLSTKASFDESLASFNARGIGKVYVVSSEQVPQGIDNEEAVASYVAGLITGDAKVYVSDIVELPELEADGAYTGSGASFRFVYIQ